MKVLITGGAGFIGSHIADFLVGRGYNVVMADNLITGKKGYVNKQAISYDADITGAIKGEVRDIALDTSLTKKELGWKPKTGLREGIKETFEWFRENI